MTPLEKTARDTSSNFKPILIYLLLVFVIVFVIYYLPDYHFLEIWIANQSSFILNTIGVPTQINLIGNGVYINEIQVVRDCTGIQVIAVFAGLLLPVPKALWRKKVAVIILISLFVYFANLLRVVLEYWLLAERILPWSLAHYPMSFVLGVFGVVVLVILTDKIMPEFVDFISSEFNRFRLKLGRVR